MIAGASSATVPGDRSKLERERAKEPSACSHRASDRGYRETPHELFGRISPKRIQPGRIRAVRAPPHDSPVTMSKLRGRASILAAFQSNGQEIYSGRGAWFRSTAGSISPSKPYLARMFHNIRSAYFGKAVRIKVSFFFPARARSVVMPRASRYPVDGNVLPSFAV